MRIAQVSPLYESVPPKLYGGTERVVSWLTEELVRAGHDVTLFASGDSLTQAQLVSTTPQALRLNPDCIDQLAHHVVMLEKVFSERQNFDLIHFHIDYLHFSFSRNEQLTQLTTLHGRLDIPDLVPVYQAFPEMPVVSISDAQRKPLPWANWKGTVHHGLPKDSFEFYPERGKYLAFLGRTSPEKGLDRAIEIAKHVGIPLKIAAKVDRGDREYFESCIKPLLDHPLIEFLGEIGYAEKNDFLGNALALLFPIDWPEPFGLVMIEAMACGTPVIAFPNGSVPEIVRNGVSGFTVRDTETAVRAIGCLDKIDRRICRKHFEQHFTSARMAQDYLKIYRQMVAAEPEQIAMPKGALSWTKLTSPSSTT
ncbi:MAG: glycosyl transferase group 1 [Acidobacteriaceae bacterium]|jgi:glycosyltransferase involved in cell wall biosynthesis|nr:glycosyl transferase group 1 [Acidobacteriaceae bacterium]